MWHYVASSFDLKAVAITGCYLAVEETVSWLKSTYAGYVGRRLLLRDDEVHVISVTPVGRGIVRPLLVVILDAAIVQWSSHHVPLVRSHYMLSLLVLVGPALVVVATRTWRWRSHKIHVTSERIVVEGGVARHFATSYELRDVVATRVNQRVGERMLRRGVVLLDFGEGPVFIGRIRHPTAFGRIIDRERRHHQREQFPLDTVFDFGEPTPVQYWEIPRRRRSGR